MLATATKDRPLTIHIETDAYEMVKRAAEEEGRSVSNWARRAVLRALNDDSRPSQERLPRISPGEARADAQG
ncbi:MAG TPA: hypothetical protein VMD09_12820 [Solirubrobacteraceae bacterium]|nr:hypothetical protein [Solirubrobacteraceae bacterium]